MSARVIGVLGTWGCRACRAPLGVHVLALGIGVRLRLHAALLGGCAGLSGGMMALVLGVRDCG